MSTPVHDGRDVNDVTSSGASPETGEASAVSATTTPESVGEEAPLQRRVRVSRPSPRSSSAKPAPAVSEAASADSEPLSPEPKSNPASPEESPPVAPETGSIREETDAPPTAPESAGRRSAAAAAEPVVRPSSRLPQGLGGPNIAAP